MKFRLIKGLLWVFSLLPLRFSHQLGGLIGWILANTPNSLRRISEANIRLCLPELPATAQRRLVRDSLIETGRTLLETGPLWHLDHARYRQLIAGEEGVEQIDAARDAGRGVIIVTPHLGSWEMGGHYCAQRWQITNLYRPPRMPELEQIIVEGRTRLGARVVPTTARGIRSLYKTLREGGVIAILPDQDPGASGGVFAPFFGVPANTMQLLNNIARKTGAPVFFGYCERLPKAAGYRLHFIPAPAGIDSADPVTAATATNQGVETLVRRQPEQYQWSYRRFRTRPEGEPAIY